MLKRFVKFNAAVVGSGTAFTVYHYPELRKDPGQLLNAMRRGGRCIKTCIMMGIDYVSAGENITSETHYKAANRMFKCFCDNGGPYIKLGQMFGQLQNLVPDEYCEVFEPMCMRAPTTAYPDVKFIVE